MKYPQPYTVTILRTRIVEYSEAIQGAHNAYWAGIFRRALRLLREELAYSLRAKRRDPDDEQEGEG